MTGHFPLQNILSVTLVFMAFAFVHSLCVTDTVKRMMTSLFGEMFVKGTYRYFFTCFSVVTLGICVYIVHSFPDKRVILITGLPWVTFHLLQITGLVIGGKAFSHIHIPEFLGISQFIAYVRYRRVEGDEEGLRDNRLVVSGIYRKVRHPLYLAGILVFTFNPYITVNTLIVTILADLYFIFGAFIEEKRLLNRFGSEYREYMQQVPRLIPSLRPDKWYQS